MDTVLDSIDSVSSEGVSLRVQLQRAIDEERCIVETIPWSDKAVYKPCAARSIVDVHTHAFRYTDAASLRDRLQEVQQLMDRIEAKRSTAVPTQPVRFMLGQRVTLKDGGRRGVICGWGALAMFFVLSCSASSPFQAEKRDCTRSNLSADGTRYAVRMRIGNQRPAWTRCSMDRSSPFTRSSLMSVTGRPRAKKRLWHMRRKRRWWLRR